MAEAKWIQGENNVNVVGTVAENNLEIKEFKDKKTNVPYSAMVGYITVQVAENENHQIHVFARQHTKDGNVSKMFKGLNTIKNEVVSIADKAEAPIPEEVKPSKVSVFGTLDDNSYYREDELIQNTRIRGINISRVDGQPVEPKAGFEIEGMVAKVLDETDSEGIETGRKKVELLVPDFKPDGALVGRIVPLTVVVPEGPGADYVEDEFEKGSTVLLLGDIVNFRKETKKETEMGFGNAKVDTKVEYKREFLVHQGLRYDDENPRTLDPELMKQAQVQYNIQLEEGRAESKPKQQQTGGFGFGPDTNSDVQSKKEKVNDLF